MDYGTQTLWPGHISIHVIRGEAGFDSGRHSATTLRRGVSSVASTFKFTIKICLIRSLPTNDFVPLKGAIQRIIPRSPGDDAFLGEQVPSTVTVGKVVTRVVAEPFCFVPFAIYHCSPFMPDTLLLSGP